MTQTPFPNETLSSLRFREAEHRHRNTLQMLSSMARRRLRSSTNSEVRESISYVVELIEILARLEQQASNGNRTSLCDRLEDMSQHWQRLANGNIKVLLDVEDDIVVPSSEETIICLIAHELVVNAFKHAFPNGMHGSVRVRLKMPTGHRALLAVEDDGIGPGLTAGCQLNPEKNSSQLGSSLVDSLARSLRGTVSRGRAQTSGMRVAVHWPI